MSLSVGAGETSPHPLPCSTLRPCLTPILCYPFAMRDKFDIKFIRSFQDRYHMIPGGSGCWEWSGPYDKDGYGVIKRLGKTYRAHRVSFTIHNGKIPEGLMILHSCDNPKCVNPAHLSPGTAKDNSDDMIRRGRKAVVRGAEALRGARNARAKLTSLEVLRIRCRASEGESQAALAREFNVSDAAICNIIARRSWKHI